MRFVTSVTSDPCFGPLLFNVVHRYGLSLGLRSAFRRLWVRIHSVSAVAFALFFLPLIKALKPIVGPVVQYSRQISAFYISMHIPCHPMSDWALLTIASLHRIHALLRPLLTGAQIGCKFRMLFTDWYLIYVFIGIRTIRAIRSPIPPTHTPTQWCGNASLPPFVSHSHSTMPKSYALDS